MKNPKQDPKYRLTPLGLISAVADIDIETAKAVTDGIELYLRRTSMAIAIDEENKLNFVQIEKID